MDEEENIVLRNWFRFLPDASLDRHGQMSKELIRRTADVFNAWHAIGFDRPFVESILQTVAETQDYPNCYFLPTDCLSNVIDDESYDFSSCELIRKLASRFGVADGEFERAMHQNATMQTLVECVKDGM